MYTKERFASRLYNLRSQKNMSARMMSELVGKNSGYINTIENKKALPAMNVFFSICEYLGIEPKDFFDDEDNLYPSLLNEIIADMKTLSYDQLVNLSAIVKGLKK